MRVVSPQVLSCHFAGSVPFAHCDISPASWQTGEHDLGPAGTGVLVDALARLPTACRVIT